MRSGAVSRLFAGTADRDTSCQEKQRDYVLLARTKGLKKKTDPVYAHSAAYLDSGAELSGTCKRVSFDRKFCGGEHFLPFRGGRQFVSSIANRDYTLILGLTIFMGGSRGS